MILTLYSRLQARHFYEARNFLSEARNQKSLAQTSNFSLTSFICSCVRQKINKFSLTRNWFKSWHDQLLNQENNSCVRPTRKNCLPYTRENKLVKKFVKEKLLVCAGLNCLRRMTDKHEILHKKLKNASQNKFFLKKKFTGFVTRYLSRNLPDISYAT